MNTSESIDKIIPAFLKAQHQIPLIPEGGTNTHQRYNYSGIDDYVKTINPILKKNDLGLIMHQSGVQDIEPRNTGRGGCEFGVRVQMTARLVHASGQWMEASGYGTGYDASDKAVFKAITGARKYLLASMFNVASGVDPEYQPEGSQQPQNHQQQPPVQQRPTQQQQAPPQQNHQQNALPPVDPYFAEMEESHLGETAEIIANAIATHFQAQGATVGKVIQKHAAIAFGHEMPDAHNVGFFFQYQATDQKMHREGIEGLRRAVTSMAAEAKQHKIYYLVPAETGDDLPY